MKSDAASVKPGQIEDLFVGIAAIYLKIALRMYCTIQRLYIVINIFENKQMILSTTKIYFCSSTFSEPYFNIFLCFDLFRYSSEKEEQHKCIYFVEKVTCFDKN